jgi:hypothetical protein
MLRRIIPSSGGTPPVRRIALLAGLAFIAACGGSAAPAVTPADTPDAAVSRFMRAVADSNISAMAQLWGTEDGPAGVTRRPPEWQKRLELMRYYLRHDAARIVSSAVVADQPHRHAVVVQVAREGCTAMVPFVLVTQKRGGWLVNEIDIDAVGNPARRCDTGRSTGR